MAKAEFLAVGDLHLGAFGNLFPDLHDPDDLVYAALEKPLRFARKNGVRNIILLGDIFDTPEPSQRQTIRFLLWLMANKEFDIYFLPGNHDFESNESSSLETAELFGRMREMRHVQLFMRPAAETIGGVPFCFLPWPHHSKKKAGLPPGPSVNIAHVEQAGALRDNGSKSASPIELSAKEDFWIVGHLHRRQEIKKRIFYPGTLYQKTFGEPLPKGFLRAAVAGYRGVLRMETEFVETEPPFVLENLRIETAADLRKIQPYDLRAKPLRRYKLFVHDDVALPPNFRIDNPHIVRLDGWRSQREAEALETGGVALESQKPADMREILFRDLGSVLKRHGLDAAQRKKARRIVDGIITKLEAQP